MTLSSFSAQINSLTNNDIEQTMATATEDSIKSVLSKNSLSFVDFIQLISPQAQQHIEQMAHRSQQITQQRFGKTMQLYVPLYLSNMCSNICTYCGFSMGNNIRRKTLNMAEIEQEALAIKAMGFDHILLVTGESEKRVGMAYFADTLPLLKKHFSHISMEVQPLLEKDYKHLKSLGVDSILVYQETYDKQVYKQHHLKGKKSNFDYRLATPERAANAGIDKIGLGCLLGLADWRIDVIKLAQHLQYLQKYYWQSRYALSFPRLKPCEGNKNDSQHVTEQQLLQIICAFRLFAPDVEISLSTRETAYFRDNAMALGITSMSAGSVTQPGGYANKTEQLEQFSIDDDRAPKTVANKIMTNGYQVIWKDWSGAFK